MEVGIFLTFGMYLLFIAWLAVERREPRDPAITLMLFTGATFATVFTMGFFASNM